MAGGMPLAFTQEDFLVITLNNLSTAGAAYAYGASGFKPNGSSDSGGDVRFARISDAHVTTTGAESRRLHRIFR